MKKIKPISIIYITINKDMIENEVRDFVITLFLEDISDEYLKEIGDNGENIYCYKGNGERLPIEFFIDKENKSLGCIYVKYLGILSDVIDKKFRIKIFPLDKINDLHKDEEYNKIAVWSDYVFPNGLE